MSEIQIAALIIITILVLLILYVLIDDEKSYTREKIDKTRKKNLIKSIELLSNNLDNKFYLFKNSFNLSSDFKNNFYSSINLKEKYEHNLKELMEHMLLYIGMPYYGVDIEIIYGNAKNQKDYSGRYINKSDIKKKIVLVLKESYSLNTIISILAHEISHYFLYSRNIKLDDVLENEILTDVCAIYLGFGSFMIDGYEKKITHYDNSILTSKIGYIDKRDIEFVIKELEKIKQNYIIRL